MKRHAFTLVELLVVVAVIGLLMTIMMPQLSRARSLARQVQCAGNLREIDKAFRGLMAGGQTNGKAYCSSDGWPGLPMTVLPERPVYMCPESVIPVYDVSEYLIRNKVAGVDVPFKDQASVPGGQGLCRLIEDTASYSIWGFEGGTNRDLWSGGANYLTDGSVDIAIRVSKKPPLIGTNLTTGFQGAGDDLLSLCLRGKVVKRWEDFRTVATGATFEMDGGSTNYGINAAIGGVQVAPGTIVLLDYVERVATGTPGAAITHGLRLSVRHVGKINVLDSDGGVRAFGPTQLDPAINPGFWSP